MICRRLNEDVLIVVEGFLRKRGDRHLTLSRRLLRIERIPPMQLYPRERHARVTPVRPRFREECVKNLSRLNAETPHF